MAKRGKYMTYNEPKPKKREKRSVAEYDTTSIRKREEGHQMYGRVAAERYRHYIGETIILNRLIQSNEKERTIGGVVVGLYPHFVLVDCGNYCTSVTYKDLVLGGRT